MIRTVIFLLVIFQTQLNSQMDTTSYSIGIVIAKNLKSQGFTELNMESFNDAMNNVFDGENLKINLEDANSNVQSYIQGKKAKLQKVAKESGEKFLAENKNRPEVRVTSTGLQYEILEKGTGDQHPSLLESVNVHYHGTLVDGTVFDSSVERNEPISFPVNGVITGWQEGLQLMTVGSKFRFFIPYHLAYGDRGAGAAIPPFSALIFDVTLIAIE